VGLPTQPRSATAAGEFLRQARQLVDRRLPRGIAAIPISQRILEPDPTMRPDAMKRDLATLEKLDQVRPRDMEYVRRRLRSQVLVVRHERDRLSAR
jgi:hypothetical protein